MSLRPIYSEHRHGERLMQLLASTDPRMRLYVYLLVNGRRVTPAIYKGPPMPDVELVTYLHKTFGGVEFEIMIRCGETMLESGTISIHPNYQNLMHIRR